MVKDEKEKNPILNPQAEGSNAASGSSSFRTVIGEVTDSEEEILSSDYDSDIDYSSDEEMDREVDEELANKIDEYQKLGEECKALTEEVKEGIAKYKNLNRKRNKEEEKEWQEILNKHEKTVRFCERINELEKEILSDWKGKGKELTKEQELVNLETSLVSWINEGDELNKTEITIGEIDKKEAAALGAYGTIGGGGIGGTAGMIIGTVLLPGLGSAVGASVGSILGGMIVGQGTTALVTRNQEKEIRKQTKKQLEDIVLTLTKREQEEKNNLIRYLTIVKEKMNEKDEELEKVKSEKAGLTRQLNKAEAKATAAEKELREKAKEDAEEKARIDKKKGEIQKALQSAEKSEIEQLKAERNQLRATSGEQEAFLNRWIREYNRLELEKQDTILAMEELFLKFKQRGRENGELTIKNARLETAIVGLQGNIKTQKIEIKNLTNSRDTARNERDTAREELGKLKLEKIQWVHDKKRLEEERDEAVRTMESLGYPKWFKRSTDFLGVESANQIWGKGVFIGRFALLLLVGAILFYIGSWILRILVGIFKNLKAIFTKKQDTAAVLKEMLTGMKEAKDSVIKKVKRVKKTPVEEVKEVEIIEEISSEKTDPISEEKPAKGSKNGKNGKGKKKGKK